jgi:hypothetical protein
MAQWWDNPVRLLKCFITPIYINYDIWNLQWELWDKISFGSYQSTLATWRKMLSIAKIHNFALKQIFDMININEIKGKYSHLYSL